MVRLNAKLEATDGLGQSGFEEALEELEAAEEELKMMWGLALIFEGWPSLPRFAFISTMILIPALTPMLMFGTKRYEKSAPP